MKRKWSFTSWPLRPRMWLLRPRMWSLSSRMNSSATYNISCSCLEARGIFEQQLMKCLVEMKRQKLCSTTMKFNASGVIQKILECEATLPKGGPSARLAKKAAECKSDLSTLYSTLSREIHGAPWSGPGIKVHMSQLRKEEQCIIQYLADDFGLELVEDKNEL